MSDKPAPRILAINSMASKEEILKQAHFISGELTIAEAALAEANKNLLTAIQQRDEATTNYISSDEIAFQLAEQLRIANEENVRLRDWVTNIQKLLFHLGMKEEMTNWAGDLNGWGAAFEWIKYHVKRSQTEVAQLQTTISQLEARTNAEALQVAWRKYRELFGEDPHGTLPQLKAMLEFVHAEEKPAT